MQITENIQVIPNVQANSISQAKSKTPLHSLNDFLMWWDKLPYKENGEQQPDQSRDVDV